MKTLIIASVTALTSLQLTASPDVTHFDDAKIELPPLTLSEIRPEGHVATSSKVITVTSTEKKMISNMPVITPSDTLEYTIGIKEPDPDVGYALITKEVDMTSSK